MSILSCDDVIVRLGGRAVLDGVSAALAPGRVTVIVGPNGAGKSTWLSVLAGLRQPNGGTASLDGSKLSALPARERARRIGVLPQTPEVAWAVDVRTLVGLGRIPHRGARGPSLTDAEAVERALHDCGLSPFALRGVDTLSGGERTRVLIARALAGEPEWLLADEPLTGLDPGHMLDAADLFRGLAERGAGVVLTLHDLAFAARLADRVLVLGPEGRLLADAPPLEAMTPPVLAQAYGIEGRLEPAPDGPVLRIVGRAR